MPTNAAHDNIADEIQPCSIQCAEYGTHTCCPPLIVLAMRPARSERFTSEQTLDRARYRNSATEQERQPIGQFSNDFISGEYCTCSLSLMAEAASSPSAM